MRVLLGITGGVAAYKAAELTRLFQQNGHRVQVVMTKAAQSFITPLTFAALSGSPVLTELFPAGADPAAPADWESSVEHIAHAQRADVLVIAPATAHTLARCAQGLADDFLTTLYLATPAPVVVAPAMNVEMWRHPATVANLETLRRRGVIVVEPESGYLACGMLGAGRLAELPRIVAAAEAAVVAKRDYSGQSVLITAGPTREALDPVRYLSNRSSGRMGIALAEAAASRGAAVTLILGPVSAPGPRASLGSHGGSLQVVSVTTAEEMAAAATAAFPSTSLAILAAAVADYRAAAPSPRKLKKSGGPLSLELIPTRDILAELGAMKRDQILIGFAAETEPLSLDAASAGLRNARQKLEEKGADLIVLNDVSQAGVGFDAEENAVVLVAHEAPRLIERAPKRVIADAILDAALTLRTTPAAV